MLNNFPFYLILVVAIVLIIMLANKLKIAYPVLLVVAGLLISFIPGIPGLHIESELIFIIFLPPLLYEAAWNISWKELWRWRRIICSFAFVVVFLTALSVAFVANYFIPGFSLALGFLLGGIVSPPDAVSAGAILKFVKVPRRVSSILEGESLLNDASSLIIFRFALIAVATGQFIWYHAALSFTWMVIGGVGIGVLVGWLFIFAHKKLPTDVNMDIVLTLVTPFVIYLAAEELHSSGVLAVVSGGLLLSSRSHTFLTSASRLRGVSVWQSLVFVLNGLVFMFIGLALPEITAGLEKDIGLRSAIEYGLLVTAALVVGRILAAYGAVIFTMIARNFITVADARNPGIKGPFLLGWTGMRGVVSLAAALSIPTHLGNGALFPQRNLILFITFIVILLTLVIQGLTLPFLIRKFKLPDPDETIPAKEQDHLLQNELSEQAAQHIRSTYGQELQKHPALQKILLKYEKQHLLFDDEWASKDLKNIYLDLINFQRQFLIDKNHKDLLLDEEIVRKHLWLLDLEEARIRSI
ncbi:MAG: Na+/H+ antiporter [Ginsengibacter sp.]